MHCSCIHNMFMLGLHPVCISFELDFLKLICFLLLSLMFRVVNGALEYLAKDLGIAENTVLQGKL